AIRHKRHVDDAELVESLSSAEVSPELGVDFQAAIARLPPGMRRIFVLHDIEGYKHDEIASMLGIAQGTSKSQLHRVRMILRKYLGASRLDDSHDRFLDRSPLGVRRRRARCRDARGARGAPRDVCD